MLDYNQEIVYIPDPVSSESGVATADKSTTTGKTSAENTNVIQKILNLGTIALALIGIGVVFVIACCFWSVSRMVVASKRDLKSVSLEHPESRATETTITAQTLNSTETTGTTTMVNSDYGLAIPAYLKYRPGVDVRPIREIARGGFSRVVLSESLTATF